MVPKWYYIKSCYYPALMLISMSACLQLRGHGIARVRRWCLQSVSRACPGRVEVECDVCPRQLTAVQCRPDLVLVHWQRVDAVPGRPGSAIPGPIGARALC